MVDILDESSPLQPAEPQQVARRLAGARINVNLLANMASSLEGKHINIDRV